MLSAVCPVPACLAMLWVRAYLSLILVPAPASSNISSNRGNDDTNSPFLKVDGIKKKQLNKQINKNQAKTKHQTKTKTTATKPAHETNPSEDGSYFISDVSWQTQGMIFNE